MTSAPKLSSFGYFLSFKLKYVTQPRLSNILQNINL